MEINNKDILAFKTMIDASETICLGSHMNPDGDNIGSLCGMYEYLTSINKSVTLLIDDEIPNDFVFLSTLKNKKKLEEVSGEEYDLFISLDCADLDRLNNLKDVFLKSKHTINIDHHKTNTKFADLNIILIISSTGEVLYKLFKDIKFPMNKKIATCLYTAISSDTGSFKYDSTTSETYRAVAELMEYGININEVTVNLYQKRSYEKTQLLLSSVSNAIYDIDRKIGLVKIYLNDIETCKAKSSDTEGIIEFLRDIEPIEIAVLLKERVNEVKVSIRTKSKVDATKIVVPFGGGGHSKAAGGTFKGTMEECQKIVCKLAKEELKNAGNISSK